MSTIAIPSELFVRLLSTIESLPNHTHTYYLVAELTEVSEKQSQIAVQESIATPVIETAPVAAALEAPVEPAPITAPVVAKKRGRKAKSAIVGVATPEQGSEVAPIAPTGKKRGRKPKIKVESTAGDAVAETVAAVN